jgi:methyl-accepting chemotaxis protein
MWDFRKSVKTKLGLGFGLTLALVCALGAVALITVVRVADGTAEIYDKNLQGIAAIAQARQALSHLQAEINDRVRSGTPEDLAALAKDMPKAQQRIRQAWDRYYPTRVTTASEKQIAQKAYTQLQKTGPVLTRFSTMAKKMDFNDAAEFYKATQFFKTTLTKTLQAFSARLNKLQQIQLTAARQAYQQAQTSALQMKMLIAGAGLAVLVLMLVTAFLLTRMITRPLSEARGFVQRIAGGNLHNRRSTVYQDEFGVMIGAIEAMRERLSAVVQGVRDSSDSVNVGVGQIASGNDELNHRSQEQAANLEETAASMEQMTATVKQNADNAAQADQLAQGVRRQAGEGSEVVARAVASMQAIDAASHKITDIVGLIDDIAFQTNLLALNASVEAARAGEQGRGFAVVASEVRNLASRSAAAAKDIKALVEDSADKVAEGSREVALSGTTLDEIVV